MGWGRGAGGFFAAQPTVTKIATSQSFFMSRIVHFPEYKIVFTH